MTCTIYMYNIENILYRYVLSICISMWNIYIYIYNICIYAYIYSKQLFTQKEKLNLKNIQQYPTGYI